MTDDMALTGVQLTTPVPAYTGFIMPETTGISESAFSSRLSSRLSRRPSSSVVWSIYDDVTSSRLASSPSSPHHLLSFTTQDTGSSLYGAFLPKSRLQRLARTFIYPDDGMALALRQTPPSAFALSYRHTEPIARPSPDLANALPGRPSYMSAMSADRRTQTPRITCTMRRRSSSRMTNTSHYSDPHSSRPASRRKPAGQEDLNVSTLEEEDEVLWAGCMPSPGPSPRKTTDDNPQFELRREAPIHIPTMSTDEEEALSRDVSFIDLVRGLAIPYITVSRSSTPNDVLDVRTMSEVVGRVRSAKKHLPPPGGSSSSASSRSPRSKPNQPFLTPGGGSRGNTNQGGLK